MKRVLLALALLGVVSGVGADPNDLSDGVLITHAPPDFNYSPGLDWCTLYGEMYGITTCDEQYTNMPITGDPTMQTLFYVVAAWNEDKVWCGTEFGISPNFNELFYFTEWGPCLVNSLENSTGGWPGPGEGTAVVATDTPWEGNFAATYYFLGYAYYESVVALDLDPAQVFAGTGNCDVPAQTWDAVCLGAVGVGADPGVQCCPPAPPDPMVCCFESGACELLLEYDCLQAGGEYHPEWDTCDPNPCDQPPVPGACCIDTGECFYILMEECDTIGGEFLGEEIPCDPNPCPQPSVCCVGPDCYVVYSEDECTAMDGDWYPDWDTCDPNPCPVPTDGQSWGSIKVLYR